MVESTTLFGLAQTLAIVVGVIIALMELRHMRQTRDTELETRQAQLYMQLYSFYDNKDFLKDYGNIKYVYEYDDLEDWMRKYSPPVDIDAYASWLRVGRFLDGVGILLKKNLIEIDLINELLSDVIFGSWIRMAPWLKENRENLDRPQLWRNFEYLYNRLIEYIEADPELKFSITHHRRSIEHMRELK